MQAWLKAAGSCIAVLIWAWVSYSLPPEDNIRHAPTLATTSPGLDTALAYYNESIQALRGIAPGNSILPLSPIADAGSLFHKSHRMADECRDFFLTDVAQSVRKTALPVSFSNYKKAERSLTALRECSLKVVGTLNATTASLLEITDAITAWKGASESTMSSMWQKELELRSLLDWFIPGRSPHRKESQAKYTAARDRSERYSNAARLISLSVAAVKGEADRFSRLQHDSDFLAYHYRNVITPPPEFAKDLGTPRHIAYLQTMFLQAVRANIQNPKGFQMMETFYYEDLHR